MKKLLLICLIFCAVGFAACGETKVEGSGEKNDFVDPNPDAPLSYSDPLLNWGASRAAIKNAMYTKLIESVDLSANRHADIYKGSGSVLEYQYVFNNDDQLIEVYTILSTGRAPEVDEYLQQSYIFTIESDAGERLYQDREGKTVVALYFDLHENGNEYLFVWYVDRKVALG